MKKRYRILIGLLCFIILLMIIGAFFQDSDQIGKFRTAEGERSYKETYENAMKNLPDPNKAWDVETDFGSVRVYQYRLSQ